MTFLTELWLPILLASVFVFIVSSVIHMVLKVHKSDYKKLKNEDLILDTFRSHGIQAGQYVFPCADSMKEMGSPEMEAKRKRGPVGWLNILPPGSFNIGKNLMQWFLNCLLISVLVAYLAWHSLQPGASFMAVFRIAGVAAILAYAVGRIDDSIWRGVPWSTTAKFLFDGIVYGLATAATFAWLWPNAAS